MFPELMDLLLTKMATYCQDVVVAGSWNCVYAEDEAEFEAIWDKMVEDAMALGAEDVINWYLGWHQPVIK